MIIDAPSDTAPLRALWKEAFGDPDSFLDAFFSVGYHPSRCRQLRVDGKLAAMLYWFDCTLGNARIAYLYAIATDSAFQKKGYCHALMDDTHRHLAQLGYAGTVLVPQSASLFAFYEKMGYRAFGGLQKITCQAGLPVPVNQISTEEYATARRAYLPDGAVVQEGAFLDMLSTQVSFYQTKESVFCAYRQADTLIVPELLGNLYDAEGIVAALGAKQGHIRTVGNTDEFAMYLPLDKKTVAPCYFGLALD